FDLKSKNNLIGLMEINMNIKALLTEFIEDESGLTAVEYAIADGLVVGGMIGAFNLLGDNATAKISCLASAVGGGSQNCP
ncbi:MAG: pilus assembly protein Flp/PilA, partial [Oleiphilaceae bacterium]